MNEPISSPEGRPPARPGRIWPAILLPPALTLLTSLIGTACCPTQDGDAMVFLIVTPAVGILAIIAFSIIFLRAISPRCSGAATGFLYLTYLFGEFGICLAVWFASCSMMIRI